MLGFARPMKEFLFPLVAIQALPLGMTETQYNFWDRMAERWGIGLVGLVLLFFLARWTSAREAKALVEQRNREDAMNAERLAALERGNQLQEQAIAAQAKHSQEMKQIIRDGNKYQSDVGIELKNIARRVNCPAPCLHSSPP